MKVGYEHRLVGTEHKDVVITSELVDFYIKVLNLYYDDPDAQKWVAQKMKEDVVMLSKYHNLPRKAVLLEWLRWQWKLINTNVKDKYKITDEYFNDDGKLIQEYEVWLEEK